MRRPPIFENGHPNVFRFLPLAQTVDVLDAFRKGDVPDLLTRTHRKLDADRQLLVVVSAVSFLRLQRRRDAKAGAR